MQCSVMMCILQNSTFKGKSSNANQKEGVQSKTENAAVPEAADEAVKSAETKPADLKTVTVKKTVESDCAVVQPEKERNDAVTPKAENRLMIKKTEDVDCGKYDKGRKTFTYALPFSAKVHMSVKAGGYRLMAESMGRLGVSEKKDIGRLVLKSISAYRGEDVQTVDKEKISIDVKYDEETNRTQVFMIVPFNAIER